MSLSPHPDVRPSPDVTPGSGSELCHQTSVRSQADVGDPGPDEDLKHAQNMF